MKYLNKFPSKSIIFLNAITFVIMCASCDVYRIVEFSNPGDSRCLVVMDYDKIKDNKLRLTLQDVIGDTLHLSNNGHAESISVLDLGISGWTTMEYEAIKSSVEDVFLISDEDTINVNKLGFDINVMSLQGLYNRKLIVECPLVIQNIENNEVGLYYFPMKVFKDTSIFIGHDTFVNRWYSKHLSAMKEPTLFNNDKEDHDIIRFLWLRTFDNPVAIRLEKSRDGKYWLTGTMLSGAGGYDPGELKGKSKIQLSNSESRKVDVMVEACDFYNMNTIEERFGKDGSQWIVELNINDNYHVVDRWSPNENDCIYLLGQYLLKISDLKNIGQIY